MSAGAWGKQGGGSYGFDNGHMLLWTQWANPEDRPNFPKADEYSEKFGEAMSKWMIERSRNLMSLSKRLFDGSIRFTNSRTSPNFSQ